MGAVAASGTGRIGRIEAGVRVRLLLSYVRRVVPRWLLISRRKWLLSLLLVVILLIALVVYIRLPPTMVIRAYTPLINVTMREETTIALLAPVHLTRTLPRPVSDIGLMDLNGLLRIRTCGSRTTVEVR